MVSLILKTISELTTSVERSSKQNAILFGSVVWHLFLWAHVLISQQEGKKQRYVYLNSWRAVQRVYDGKTVTYKNPLYCQLFLKPVSIWNSITYNKELGISYLVKWKIQSLYLMLPREIMNKNLKNIFFFLSPWILFLAARHPTKIKRLF